MNKRTKPIKEEEPILAFESAQQWDAWLERNGASVKAIRIRIAKKDSGIPSVTYAEAVDTAICHGWIDGVRNAYDDKTFLQRFTPRGPRSIWSEINKKKVQQLAKAKLMRPAGLAAVKRAKANGQWDKAYAPASTIQMPLDLAAALKKNRKAKAFFDTLKGSSRFAFLHRLHTAKKEETRAKRLSLFIAMMERGEAYHALAKHTSDLSPQRTCPNGHVFTKTSDCPTCPQCEADRAPVDGWMAKLGAPARRALEGVGIRSLEQLAARTEKDLLALHGFGPATLPVLRKVLNAVGLQFTTPAKSMRDLPKTTTSTDEYLRQLPKEQRNALQRVRKQILAAVPGTQEDFAYGVPAFRYNGHPLVYMGASRNHCGLYGSVPPDFKEALKGFKMGKGSIQFTPVKPIPADVLKALLRAKAAEIEVRWGNAGKSGKVGEKVRK
ncbi:MAG TPA: YdeI/OmpD-associated family protein [Flavobacteriales bacterium]|nr:YdeI/OmpD-associated family protein [Flavobacteriales bacterium]